MNDDIQARAARDELRLAGRIAGLPRPEVPEDILSGVMARVRPRRPSLVRRLTRRLRWLAAGPGARTILAGGLAGLAIFLGARFVFDPAASGPAGQPAGAAQVATGGPSGPGGPGGPDAAGFRLTGAPAAAASEVTFVAHAPGAEKVAVVGSFNGWNPAAGIMRKAQGGEIFTLTMRLPRGRHVYAFLVDGTVTRPDPGALIQEDDGFGNTNSVLVLDAGETGNNGGYGHERPL